MIKPKDIIIEKLVETQNEAFLEILWTALNIKGADRDRSILFDPIIKPYYENWGEKDDLGYTAIKNDHMVGAIWCRIKECVTEKYSEYPELGMGVLPNFQNKGIGSYLLQKLIDVCKKKYYGLRLGINPNNKRAIRFYKRFGFEEYEKYKGSPQMKLTFSSC